jgi:hypothetical protein
MVGAEVVFLLLVQAQAQDVADALDSAVQKITAYRPPEAPIIDDEAFLRRIFKDLIDAVPPDAELQAFVADATPDKRARMVDRLLDDDRFAEFWSKRFSKAYFGDLEKPRPLEIPDKPAGIERRLVLQYQGWLRDKLKKDTPWTRIVAETLDARGTTEGDPALGYLLSFRRGAGAPIEFANGVSRDFLGIRMHCARCHDHPYDRWATDQFYSLAAFMARQEAKVVGGEIMVRYLNEGELKDSMGKLAEPKFLFGGKPDANDDRMKMLGFYMAQKGTTQLPRALANRVWDWLFGAGIVNPADNFNLRNKPVSPDLLPTLVKDQIEANYSVKRLVRVICATKAYQRASPEESPGTMSFRHLVSSKIQRYRIVPLEDPPKLPLTLEVPGPWTRVRPLAESKAMYLVRGKVDATQSALVSIHEGKKDEPLLKTYRRQIFRPQSSSAPLEPGSAVTLHEISGNCQCFALDLAPTPWLVWVLVVETPAGAYTLKFDGEAAVVREWRDEFITLVKSAR